MGQPWWKGFALAGCTIVSICETSVVWRNLVSSKAAVLHLQFQKLYGNNSGIDIRFGTFQKGLVNGHGSLPGMVKGTESILVGRCCKIRVVADMTSKTLIRSPVLHAWGGKHRLYIIVPQSLYVA